jgi:hypothetical protein
LVLRPAQHKGEEQRKNKTNTNKKQERQERSIIDKQNSDDEGDDEQGNEAAQVPEEKQKTVGEEEKDNVAEASTERQNVDAPVVKETPTESRGRSLQRTESRANSVGKDRSRSRPAQQGQVHSSQLFETLARTGTTGRGLGILERRQEETPGLLAFLAHDRLNIPMAANYSKSKYFQSTNDKKEARGKT